jgi:hypothetical protein
MTKLKHLITLHKSSAFSLFFHARSISGAGGINEASLPCNIQPMVVQHPMSAGKIWNLNYSVPQL